MRYLMNQEEFEQLLGRQPVPEGTVIPHMTVIYFTATWCGACRKLDIPALEAAVPEVNWLKCDVDQNNYTAGYCGVRSIPTFLIVADKKVVDTYSSSDNFKVETWIRHHMTQINGTPTK
jgi:thioredoxin-like negative regulator of GroEL